MQKKWWAIWIVVSILLLVFAFPYARVELLTRNAEKKLESFELSCFDNIYCEGTPLVYDRKIYSYRKNDSARVLYVLGDCEFGVMVELRWNHNNDCWELLDYQNMWTVHGGSAQEFYWPLYYVNKLYPLLGD